MKIKNKCYQNQWTKVHGESFCGNKMFTLNGTIALKMASDLFTPLWMYVNTNKL